MERKTLLILTGAGFSQSYLKNDGSELSSIFLLNVITQREIFKSCYLKIYHKEAPENLLVLQSISSPIWGSLQDSPTYRNAIYPPNFETIFYILNQLCQSQNRKITRDDSENEHHTYYLPNLFSTVKPEWDVNFYFEDLYHFKNFVLAVVSQFSADELSRQKLNQFINKLKEQYSLRHYSLNYDDLFIQALDYGTDAIGTMYEWLPSDFNFGHDTQKMTRSNIFSNTAPNCSFQLHGSVNYSIGFHTMQFHLNKDKALQERGKAHTYITEEMATGELRDWTSIIVGYEKDKILNVEPYSSIHLKFGTDILSANEILILGYSFSDEHINKWLAKFIVPLNRPYAIQPSKVKKIKIVDLKSSNQEIEEFKERFMSTARQSGDDVTAEFNLLKTEQLSEKIRYIKRDNFYLEFDFEGVDNFIDHFNSTGKLFKNSSV